MGELLRDLASVDGEIAVSLLVAAIPKNGSTTLTHELYIYDGHGDRNKTQKTSHR